SFFSPSSSSFFFTLPAPTQISTLSLHDALPISGSSRDCLSFMISSAAGRSGIVSPGARPWARSPIGPPPFHTPDKSGLPSASLIDRKSTRLNSSHDQISYAVFCLKKKKKKQTYL